MCGGGRQAWGRGVRLARPVCHPASDLTREAGVGLLHRRMPCSMSSAEYTRPPTLYLTPGKKRIRSDAVFGAPITTLACTIMML